MDKAKKLELIEEEIDKLKTLQSKLIRQKHNFEDKLKIVKLTPGQRKAKLEEFLEKYYNYRLKIGKKWMKLCDMKMELNGRPKVQVNENELDSIYNSLG